MVQSNDTIEYRHQVSTWGVPTKFSPRDNIYNLPRGYHWITLPHVKTWCLYLITQSNGTIKL
jgi:hypothetical protein